MDYRLTEEERMFQKTVREWCTKNLTPRTREIDSGRKIPDEVIKGMADLGLFGITIPPEYGGGGNVTLATLGAMEVGRGDVSMATAVYYLLVNGWARILAKFGTEECKREILPDVAGGKKFIGIAATEPGGGSDVANFKMTAQKEGDEYALNGEKMFISCGLEAKRNGGGHLTLARTAPGTGFKGMSFFYVPADLDGIKIHAYEDMGRMGISTCSLVYEDARIPAHYLLGEEGKGFYHTMTGFDVARNLVSAACVGAGDKGLEMGIDYIKQRTAFGRPIGKFEGIQFELADLYSELELVKNLVLKAAWQLDEFHYGAGETDPKDIARNVAIVKLRAPQIAFNIYKAAMQWYGAAGYTDEYNLEMGFRGIMSYLVGAEGALNIMRIIIGRELLGKEFIPYK